MLQVIRTHDVPKNPYIPRFLHTILGPHYYHYHVPHSISQYYSPLWSETQVTFWTFILNLKGHCMSEQSGTVSTYLKIHDRASAGGNAPGSMSWDSTPSACPPACPARSVLRNAVRLSSGALMPTRGASSGRTLGGEIIRREEVKYDNPY